MSDEKPNIESSSNRLRASKNVKVAFKLNGRNYPLWSRLMKVQIGCRGVLAHITGKPTPPEPGSKEYEEWEEADLIVFSWIVDNIENDIIADFAHHLTSKAIWDSLATTFESEADLYLIYELDEKANSIKQGSMDLETYYRKIHGMWISIDRSQKSPVDYCDKGINQFRVHSNTKRLFKFLSVLNQDYDSIRRDILKEVPLPSVEAAYGWVKREAARQRIMPPSSPTPITDGHGSADSSLGEIGYGFGVQIQRQTNRGGNSRPGTAAPRPGNKPPPDKTKMWCSHCGQQRHTARRASNSMDIRSGGRNDKRRRRNSPFKSLAKQGDDRLPQGEAVGTWRMDGESSRRRRLHPVEAAEV